MALIRSHGFPAVDAGLAGGGGRFNFASDSVAEEFAGITVGEGFTVALALGLEGEIVVFDPAMFELGLASRGGEFAPQFVVFLLEGESVFRAIIAETGGPFPDAVWADGTAGCPIVALVVSAPVGDDFPLDGIAAQDARIARDDHSPFAFAHDLEADFAAGER